MKARVEFREAALRDIEDLLDHLAAASPGAAARFVAAIESAARRLSSHPLIGHPAGSRIPALEGLRTWPVPGFSSVLLVMIAHRRRVSVLRVVHGARDLPDLLASTDD